jgi:hypothetical protein
VRPVGGKPPYAAVILIHGLTEHPIVGPYVRGKLALADIELASPLASWLDAVWAAYAEAPHELLQKLNAELVKKSAMLDPEEARATWGVAPEHVAMAGRLGRGRGLEAGEHAGTAPQVRQGKPGAPAPAAAPSRIYRRAPRH